MSIIRIAAIEEQLAARSDAKSLFDIVRKKHVAATPEERVRQLFLRYLIEQKNFPRAWLAVEASLSVNRLLKRCDILVYKEGVPVMIAECKSPLVKIDQSVLEQAARYNLTLKVPYLVVTNGLITLCSRVDLQKGTVEFLNEMPDYARLRAAGSGL